MKRMEEISKEYFNKTIWNKFCSTLTNHFNIRKDFPSNPYGMVYFKYSGKFENNKWIIEVQYYDKFNEYDVRKKKKECIDVYQYDRIIYELFEACSNPHLGINQ